MNEDPMPGTSAADQELTRRWQRQSLEEPSSSTDARIRAAARDAPDEEAVRLDEPRPGGELDK